MERRALARKAVAGFLQLIVCLGLMLFGPAWTLNYWEAWVTLVLFAAPTAFITTYLWRNDAQLLERRVNAGPTAEKAPAQKLIQVFASVFFVGIFVVSSLDHRFAWSHVPLAVVVAGDLLVVLGFLIVFLTFKENAFAAATIDVAPGQKVVSTGPYAIVRHPMYAGALIMLAGTPLALGSWCGLAMLVPMTIVIVLRLLDEERFLARNLAGYDAYCRKVRCRLVPLVW